MDTLHDLNILIASNKTKPAADYKAEFEALEPIVIEEIRHYRQDKGATAYPQTLENLLNQARSLVQAPLKSFWGSELKNTN